MNFTFKLPSISEGYYKIMNFPCWFKNSNLEIYTVIEFAHIILEKQNGFNVEKVISWLYRDVNIETLLLLKLGDKFSHRGTKINSKAYYSSVILESYENCTFNISTKEDALFNTERSIGTRYYSFEKKDDEKDSLTIIIPSIVIGQSFFLVNSILIKNLFQADFTEIKNLLEWKKNQIDDITYGEISLKKCGTQEEKSMAKAFSFFLFSKNDYLMKNLVKLQSHLYQKLISNKAEKYAYNFLIPIKEKLKLIIKGNYQNINDKKYFIANEIVEVKNENNFRDLYETDSIIFYNGTSPNETSTGDSAGFPTKKRKNKKSTTITDEGVNPDLSESYIESGNSLLSKIVNLSIVQKLTDKGKVPPTLNQKETPFNTFNDKLPDPSSNSGDLTSGKNHDQESLENNEVYFSMINFLKRKLQGSYTIEPENIDDKYIRVYKLTNSNFSTLYIAADCFNFRIQIFHKADLSEITGTALNNRFNLMNGCNYSWKKLDNLKDSMGIIVGTPTNYNHNGTRIEKKEKKDNGIVEKIRVSNLCYLNLKKKIDKIFDES